MSIKTAGKVLQTLLTRVDNMEAGFNKNFTPKQSLTVDGKPLTQGQLLAKLGAVGALFADITTAKNGVKVAVAAKNAALPAARQLLVDLEQALKQLYGSRSAVLPDYGINLPKPRAPRTAEEKALSAAQGKRTRGVRGTMTPKERAKITTAGKPGLVLVDPAGTLVPGVLTGPTPPGSATPSDATAAPASGGATNGASGPQTPSGK
ncbi:MAG: WS/DGAT domain-containing protein [Deltaproteobacteria bacterium]